MAISVTNIGTNGTAGGTSTNISATVPSGAMIFVAWHDNGTAGANASLSDAVSNTYTLLNAVSLNNANANGRGGCHYVQSATALSAQNITCTPTASSGAGFTLFYATGLTATPLDSAYTATAFGTGTATSVIAAAVTTVASSLVVGVVAYNGATFTQDSTHAAYAAPPTAFNPAGNVRSVAGGNVISSSKLTYAPTIASNPWAAFIYAFKPGSTNVNVTLSDVSSSGAVGTLTPSDAATPTGVAGTGAVGTFTPSDTVTLPSVSSSGAVGTFTPSDTITLSGVSSSGAAGIIGPSDTVTLSGVSSSGACGDLSSATSISIPLSGVSSVSAVGTFAVEIDNTASLTGVSTSGSLGNLLPVSVSIAPVTLGQAVSTTISPATLTASAVAGSTVIVGWLDRSTSGGHTTISDDGGNSWTLLTTQNLNNSNLNGLLGFSYAQLTAPFTSITGTPSSNNGCAFLVFSVTTLGPVDVNVTQTNFGSGRTATVTGGTSQSNTELWIGLAATSSSPNFIEDVTNAQWDQYCDTSIRVSTSLIGSGGVVSFTNAALTYAPTISGFQRPWAAIIAAFAPQLLVGVASSGAVGTFAFEVDSTANLTGVSTTGSCGDLSSATSISITLPDVSSSGACGDLLSATSISVTLTGVETVGAAGSLSVQKDASVNLTGVSSSGAVGTLTPSISANLTGVAGTGAVGNLTATVISSVTLTGVTGTGAVGTLTPSISATLTGVAGTGAVGNLTVTVSSSVTLTGVAGTGAVGLLIRSISATLTGVAGTGAVGNLTDAFGSSVTLTGVAATGAAGSLTASIQKTLTGVASTGAVGTLVRSTSGTPVGVESAGALGIFTTSVSAIPIGVAGTGAVGALKASTQTRSLTGVSSAGAVGSPSISVPVRITGVSSTGGVGSLVPTVTATLQNYWTTVSTTGPITIGRTGYANGAGLLFFVDGTVYTTSIDAITWTQRTFPSSLNVGLIAYGNGIFLAPGGGSNLDVAISADGVNWTTSTPPWNDAPDAIAFGNGLFAVHFHDVFGNGIFFSSDGVNWPTVTSTIHANNINVLLYGSGGVWVAAFSSVGIQFSSDNGVTFSNASSGALTFAQDGLVYASSVGLFVGINNTSAWTSPDGDHWTQHASVFPTAMAGLAVNNDGVLVAVGQTSSAFSYDGVNWTSFPLPSVSTIWNCCFYGNGYFFTIEATTPTQIATLQSPFGLASRGLIGDLTAGTSAIAGVSSTGSVGTVTLGITSNVPITGVSSVGCPSNYNSWALASTPTDLAALAQTYAQGKFVVVGTNSAGYSTDGLNYTLVTSPGNFVWRRIAYGASRFVAVAYNSGKVTSSPDGINWTTQSTPGASGSWGSLAYGADIGTFVALGGTNSNALPGNRDVITSSDGVNWTLHANALPVASNWVSVAYGNGVFVALVGFPNVSNVAATSTDGGITWTQHNLPATILWSQLIFGLNQFVAFSDGNSTVATSPDGVTWSTHSMPTSSGWWAGVYGGGIYAAVIIGAAGWAVSTDAITWTRYSLPTGAFSNSWVTIAYGAGKLSALTLNGDFAATLDISLVSEIDRAISGASGTGQVASLASREVVNAKPIGVFATCHIGGLTPGARPIGVLAIGHAGSPSAAIDIALSGVSSTGEIGTVIAGTNSTTVTAVTEPPVAAATVYVSPLLTITAVAPLPVGNVQTKRLPVRGSGDADQRWLEWINRPQKKKKKKPEPVEAVSKPPKPTKDQIAIGLSRVHADDLLQRNLQAQRDQQTASAQQELNELFPYGLERDDEASRLRRELEDEDALALLFDFV